MNVLGDPNLTTAIRESFDSGHTYEVILDMLRTNHKVSVSMRSLKTYLKEAGLHRRGNYSPLREVRRAITAELRGPGQLFGYRTMWQVLKQKHNLCVKRDVVMRLLRQLNPQGIALRTRRRFTRRTYHSMGPNYIWHVDGYDKLKPFGLAISGCIDGFSRRMMWLVCGATNNNPSVIAQHYINCVKSLGVIPMRLRTDLGTENGTVAAIQCTLRHAHTDYYAGSSSHSYGSSTGNQRIESWWSFFRRGRSQFWMDLFGDLRDSGNFNGSVEHQCLLRFCFTRVLQKDLDECKNLWNNHRIRPSRLASCPGGIPNELYLLPHRYGSRDCGFPVEDSDLDVFPEASQVTELCGDKDIEEYLQQVMQQHGQQQSQNWESAMELYLFLKHIARL
ncbi:uncharacterized protein LOC111612172 [Xiphophorus maculatus]|uniref:uncharacterized protein LOC111609242 n=1 Tax=Xiphophorus maculatus TaxID=8083 RepID=UPI000C6D1942|nr:uncharacterized protein LOC111609242 [Xiphophorus maculatus]XP_023208169.1 uncharacterized protein LOC111612172 [Xiphophorus maculatus]XP_032436388.1 uncharacterized protein LOC116730923 [Xiphophorus hellerii]